MSHHVPYHNHPGYPQSLQLAHNAYLYAVSYAHAYPTMHGAAPTGGHAAMPRTTTHGIIPAAHVSTGRTGQNATTDVAGNSAASTPHSPKTPTLAIGKFNKGPQNKKGTKRVKKTKDAAASALPRSNSLPNTPQSDKSQYGSIQRPTSDPNTPPSPHRCSISRDSNTTPVRQCRGDWFRKGL